MVDDRVRLAARLAASEPMRSGIREAASDAAYEARAAALGLGPDDELPDDVRAALEPAVAAAAIAGLHAAAAAMLDVLVSR